MYYFIDSFMYAFIFEIINSFHQPFLGNYKVVNPPYYVNTMEF